MSNAARSLLGSLLLAALWSPAGCVGPFDTNDYLAYEPPAALLHEIEAIRVADLSRTRPVTIEEASSNVDATILDAADPGEAVALSLEEVRAAAIANNLDLKVDLINPSIARTSVDQEEAKFEATFSGSARWTSTDSPTAVATEGSQADFSRYDLGVNVPLRTGGTVNVNFPISETNTNNPFALLDPAYTADLTFSISQPLLRGAGNRVNTYSIRVARSQYYITSAQTKLEAIRILANADRAYWALYAAQRALEVTQSQYELAIDQLERAENRVRAGVAADVEILRSQSGVAQRLEAIIVAEIAIRRRQRDLKRIMNREDLPLEAGTALGLTSAPDPLGLDLDPAALTEFALTNRMEMLELELQLAIDTSTIDLRKNDKLPLIVLDYQYNISGLGGSYRDALDQIPPHSFEDWSVGLSAEIPIGNEVAKSQLHRAILQRVQRLATRELRVKAISQEVYDVTDQLRQTWQRILAARQDALLAGRTYRAEQRQFDVGTRTSTDVLDAATRLAEAQLSEIQALTDYQIAQVDLSVATGTLLGYSRVRWEATDVPEAEYE